MGERISMGLCELEFADRGRREGFSEQLLGEAFAFSVGSSRPVRFLGDPEGCQLGSDNNLVKVSPRPVKLPALEAVFTDKALYREGDDVVRVVAFAPSRRGERVAVRLMLNGDNLSEVEVSLDEQGLGIYEIPEPVAGEYEVHLGQSCARFTTAAYKLAPMTARFESFSLEESSGVQSLRFSAHFETFGTPMEGRVEVRLADLAFSPPRLGRSMVLDVVSGRAEGSVVLNGEGPFALQVQDRGDAMKTATLPVPGSRKSEREALELSAWGQRHIARLVPFEGARLERGLFIKAEPGGDASAPIKLKAVSESVAILKLRAEAEGWCVVALDPDTGALTPHYGGLTEAGEEIEVPLCGGASTVLLAGVLALGTAWEGRAAVVHPVEGSLCVEVPEVAEPGQSVTVSVEGPAKASVFVLVKDARLQVADTPMAASAGGLRRQIEAGLGLIQDTQIRRTLENLIPHPAPFTMTGNFGAVKFRGAPMGGAMPMQARFDDDMAFDLMECEDCDDATGGFDEFDGDCLAFDSPAPASKSEGSGGRSKKKEEAAPRKDFPEVVLAKIVVLDESGRAELEVKLGEAMGMVVVEAFAVAGRDWHAASKSLQVTREVFGELVLPRFVKAGDFAEGVLYVHVQTGEAEVEVLRDGGPVALDGEGRTKLMVSAPGESVRFVAEPGTYEAVVRGRSVDRVVGKVEEPGRLVWLQRAVRMLAPGERVVADEIEGFLGLKVLPNLDEVFDRMIGGLRGYEHCCCEQTSAVMLAAAAAWLSAKDSETRKAAALHIRGCVAREERMHLPGRGFKGWPDMPDEVFCYSPGATLNLLQMEMLCDEPMDADLSDAIDRCLEMARDAARAHGLETAPENPASAREAYGRFGQYVHDRHRMAAFIRARIEPWERDLEAILKFELPSVTTETYHRSPAMIRAETAFGAATLIESGGEHLTKGLKLANAVFDAVQENGSLYSTLDSVAAITLLTALRRARIAPGADAPCMVNGERSTVARALARTGGIRHIESIEAPIQVEISRVVEEDYTALDHGIEAAVWLEEGGRRLRGPVKPGAGVDLVIKLSSDYEAGDLVHVFLPDALSWIHGGGQIKRFSLDLKGLNQISVPLAATGLTLDVLGGVAPQHFAVCVRNMYDEDRGKGFGALSVTVARGAKSKGEGLASRVLRGLKGLF